MKTRKYNLQLTMKVNYYTEVEAETLEDAMEMGKKMFNEHCFPRKESLIERAELHADNSSQVKDLWNYRYLSEVLKDDGNG
jgi:hypothetical protein